MILAITDPWTKDFLDPQNKAVTRSSVENPNFLEMRFTTSITKRKSANIAAYSSKRTSNCIPENKLVLKERQKLEYTIRTITVLSK